MAIMEKLKIATLLFFASFSGSHSGYSGDEAKRKKIRKKSGTES